MSPAGVWNRMDHRPLEGFVLAISPFNFTSIGGNLAVAPAIVGNTVVWKPATTALLAAQVIMEILEAAGLPPGVINMIAGPGAAVSEAAVKHPSLAGIHFTGSTDTFQHLWTTVAANLGNYRTYPRLVGETGGKDFVLAHPSASTDALLVGLLRGSFEYQGQKCSAASRAYIPHSVWERLRDPLAVATEAIPVGDPAEFSTFMGAVIDEPSFRKHEAVLACGAHRSGSHPGRRRRVRRRRRMVRPSHHPRDLEPPARAAPARAVRPDPHRVPVPGLGLALGARPRGSHLALCAHRRRVRR